MVFTEKVTEFSRYEWGERMRISVINIVLFVTVSFIGCGYPQEYVAPDHPPQNKILFEGENLILIESTQSNFEQFPYNARKKESCFQGIVGTIGRKLPTFAFGGDTKYFMFNYDESNEQRIFALTLSKEQFALINLDSLKKFDSDASFTDSNNLYFLKNKEYGYLALIGHNIGSSGYGHYYQVHTLLPLRPDKPMIEFDSLGNDPRKIRIDNSGNIHYIQIDSKKLGAVTDSNDFPVTVSLFSFDNKSHKELEFDFVCKNLDETFGN